MIWKFYLFKFFSFAFKKVTKIDNHWFYPLIFFHSTSHRQGHYQSFPFSMQTRIPLRKIICRSVCPADLEFCDVNGMQSDPRHVA